MPTETTLNIQKYFLLKAEALCAELMANGVSFDDLIIKHSGSFRKSYRNDIEIAEHAKDGSEQVIIEINRDGIYDKLPEGLFHQTRGGSNTAGLKGMVGEYRRYREEERQARKFFQPIEQEFFRYAVMVEEGERKLQYGILNGNLESDFYRFWNIDQSLPKKPASVLVLIMPWIRQIKGDMQLTAKALSMILAKPVQVEERIVEEQQDDETGFMLGENVTLSMDTVCGNRFAEPYVQWVFTISSLAAHETEWYTPQKPYGKLLQRFEELFIPLNAEAQFEYHCEETIAAEQPEPILGYGFYL
ncbi:MAG: hypothetical protein WC756_00890 [Taibaiella sp.]|jgi:hypothetical protein